MLDGYPWLQAGPEYLRGSGALDRFSAIRLARAGKLIAGIRPDVILLTGWQCLGLVQILFACKQARIPVLVRAESNGLQPSSRMKSIFRRRFLLDNFNSYLVIGKANERFYLNQDVAVDRIFSSPYFVDNSFFSAQAVKLGTCRENIRRNWKIPDTACCFCFAGKLVPKKRIMDILAALEKISGKPVHLLVAGSGEQMEEAMNHAKMRSLPVTFTGFLNQSGISRAYVASDCLVLASDFTETWGLVVNEAMACSRPAIVSNRCGCHPDLVDDGETGFVFRFSDTDGLARAMARMAGMSGAERMAMGKKAQQNVIENYSICRATRGLLHALSVSIE